MPNTKDINTKEALKLLFVGENGSGKSIAAASFYLAGKIRFWDFDGRMKPIKTYFPDADIEYDTYGIDNFQDFIAEINDMSGGSGPKHKTLVLDSVTTASTTCVAYQLGVKGNLKTTKGGIPVTSWDEINGETVLFTRLLEALKSINKLHGTNIIFTAHPIPKTLITDAGSSRITSIASYGNKIPALIPSYFDEIYNFQKEKVGIGDNAYRHVMYTVPKNELPGKTAFDKMPEGINITKGNFYELLMKEINK